MANIAAPRNAESFGKLLLYTVVARVAYESRGGTDLMYQLRQVDVRDGTIYGLIEVEEESLKSVAEYNSGLKEE